MTKWYELKEDGTIGLYTNDEQSAIEFGLTLTTEREFVVGYDNKVYFAGEEPTRPLNVADYDAALEAHLKAEQVARGYTTRSPSEYANSTNARWAQDAADWVAHVTAVMEYALAVENDVKAGEPAPSLDEFKAALPTIEWTFTAEVE